MPDTVPGTQQDAQWRPSACRSGQQAGRIGPSTTAPAPPPNSTQVVRSSKSRMRGEHLGADHQRAGALPVRISVGHGQRIDEARAHRLARRRHRRAVRARSYGLYDAHAVDGNTMYRREVPRLIRVHCPRRGGRRLSSVLERPPPPPESSWRAPAVRRSGARADRWRASDDPVVAGPGCRHSRATRSAASAGAAADYRCVPPAPATGGGSDGRGGGGGLALLAAATLAAGASASAISTRSRQPVCGP